MKWPGRSRGSWDRSSTTSPTPWSTPSPGARTRFMASLRVEVVYALPLDEDAETPTVAAGGTAGEAVRASCFLQRHPEIGLRHQRIGIHGRVVTAGTLLRDGDRVEIDRKSTRLNSSHISLSRMPS